jgi:hypothetical protein
MINLIDKTSQPDYIFKTRLLQDMVELDSHDDESIYEACMGDDYVAKFQNNQERHGSTQQDDEGSEDQQDSRKK